MQIDIRSNVKDVSRWVEDVHKRHIPFATVYAMTLTAREVKDEEVSVMKRVFDRPTPYTLNALQVKPATKQTMVASVQFKEFGGTPAKRFLNPEVHGGARSTKSHERQIAPLLKGYSYLVPARGVVLDSYGNMPGGAIRKILSQLKVSPNADANASNSKRSKAKTKMEQFIVSRNGKMVLRKHSPHMSIVQNKSGKPPKQTIRWMVEPVLIGVRSPSYSKRFPFYETGETVVRERFDINFALAFERALATSNSKRKWR